MSAADTPRRLVEAVNRHDAAAAAAFFAPYAVVEDPQYPEPLRGRDAIRKDLEAFLGAFPDLQAELQSVVQQGDSLGVEVRLTGTHRGPFAFPSGEIPPTGRRIAVSFAAFDQLDEAGTIEVERRYYDLAGLMGQLGLMGSPAGTPLPTPPVA